MNRVTLILPIIFAACTAAQITATTSTLAAAASASSTTAAKLVADGALLCGDAVSPAGVLTGTIIEAVANAAGVPVVVTNALASDVAATCAGLGLVPGALPAGTDPALVPIVSVPSTALKAAS